MKRGSPSISSSCLFALVVVLVAAGSASAQGNWPIRPDNCPVYMFGTASRPSESVLASWSAQRWGEENPTLEVLVLWRGPAKWHTTGGGTGGNGRSRAPRCRPGEVTTDFGSAELEARVSGVTLSVRIDRNARQAELLGQTVSLDEFNVIVVDDAHDVGGAAHIVKTLWVDPALPLASGAAMLRAVTERPELQPWLR